MSQYEYCARKKIKSRPKGDKDYWEELCKVLEADAKIPPYKKKEVFQEILPESTSAVNLLQEIGKIVGEETEQFPILYEEYIDGAADKKTRKTIGFQATSETSKKDLERDYKEYKDKCADEYKKHNVGPKNPFVNFFNRQPDRAAIWRNLPPLAQDLNQKADCAVKKIAEDFVKWYKTIDPDSTTITVENIISMFEIGFASHAATSLNVHTVPLKSLPQSLAEATELPERSIRANLFREIHRDVAARKGKIIRIAFGQRLPETSFLPKENIAKKWLECDRVPKELASMSAVWNGITHLSSTKAFCQYLLNKPEIEPPAFLQEKGLLRSRRVTARSSMEEPTK